MGSGASQESSDALARAAATGDLAEVAMRLCQEGVATARVGNALRYACFAGELEIAELLRDHDPAATEHRDSKGRTILHAAAARDRSAVEFALAEIDVDTRDFTGATALHIACKYGDASAVEALVDAGADVAARDFQRETPDIQRDDVRDYIARRGEEKDDDISKHIAVWEVFFRNAMTMPPEERWEYSYDEETATQEQDRSWIRVVDDYQVWFHDEETGETEEEPPTILAASLEWSLVLAEEPYWVHDATGHTRWERPVLRCVDSTTSEEEYYYRDLATNFTAWTLDELILYDSTATLISEDWIRCDDPQDPYYYRISTGEAAWELPL